MERESTSNQSSSTSSCKMGCGFYGSSSFEGYCSKCYQGVVDSRVEKQCSNGSSSNGVSNRSGSPIVASDGQTPFNKNGIPVPSRSQTSFSPTSLLQEKSSSLTVSRRSSNKDIALSGEDQASALMDIDEELAATAAGEATSTTVDGNQSPSRGASTDAAPSGYQQPNSDNSAFAGTNENNNGANKNDPVLFPVGTTATADTSLAADSTALANLSMASASSGAESADGGEKSSKKRRCAMCRKKVGLTGFDCRCGGLFCTEHRYADSHACAFDYKSMEREGIRKANPVVAAEKIRKF